MKPDRVFGEQLRQRIRRVVSVTGGRIAGLELLELLDVHQPANLCCNLFVGWHVVAPVE
jgi:hypothetical protein